MGNGDILFLRNLSGKQWKRVSVGSTVNCNALGSNPCQAKICFEICSPLAHPHQLSYHQWRIQAIPGGGESNHGPIQFGYRFWPPIQQRNKHEILGNILNCPSSRMSGLMCPLAECLDPPVVSMSTLTVHCKVRIW